MLYTDANNLYIYTRFPYDELNEVEINETLHELPERPDDADFG